MEQRGGGGEREENVDDCYNKAPHLAQNAARSSWQADPAWKGLVTHRGKRKSARIGLHLFQALAKPFRSRRRTFANDSQVRSGKGGGGGGPHE